LLIIKNAIALLCFALLGCFCLLAMTIANANANAITLTIANAFAIAFAHAIALLMLANLLKGRKLRDQSTLRDEKQVTYLWL